MKQVKNLLIIYPHWPPSNLAGVHRPRLIANYIHQYGYHPIVLTVHSDYYEEEPDWEMIKTISPAIEVHSVKAKSVSSRFRLVGDIGLRAWSGLKRKALTLIQDKNIDFIWIPIPSFYTAVLGRQLFNKTGIPYGIDYIDPWVRDISNRKNLRSVISLFAAKILEPYAVKKASLITGVSRSYYEPVLERNFKKNGIANLAFPYGFDPNDHKINLENVELPWQNRGDIKPFIYAGAFLPNSRLFVKSLFEAVADLRQKGKWEPNFKFYFLGTGRYAGKSIIQYAEDVGIADLVVEERERYPFLHILSFLKRSYAVMVIGSTERHYTASKTFQSLLSERPVFAMFHEESSATQFMKEAQAIQFVVLYNERKSTSDFIESIKKKLLLLQSSSNNWEPKLKALAPYSSANNAKLFALKLNEIIS